MGHFPQVCLVFASHCLLPLSSPKTEMISPRAGARATQAGGLHQPVPWPCRQRYSLHQLLLCGRIFEASELLSSFDLVKLGLQDCLLVLLEPLLPLRSFLLLQQSALLPDLVHPGFFIIGTLRTFCITCLSFQFFLLFLEYKNSKQ